METDSQNMNKQRGMKEDNLHILFEKTQSMITNFASKWIPHLNSPGCPTDNFRSHKIESFVLLCDWLIFDLAVELLFLKCCSLMVIRSSLLLHTLICFQNRHNGSKSTETSSIFYALSATCFIQFVQNDELLRLGSNSDYGKNFG